METKMVEDNLIYPFSSLSIDNIKNIGERININDNNIYINDSILENNNILYIGLVSYIKLLHDLNNIDSEYINNFISKINRYMTKKILELKKVNKEELIDKMKLNDIPNIGILIDNIIKAYEIEYDVCEIGNSQIYQISEEKNADSLYIESEKLLKLKK